VSSTVRVIIDGARSDVDMGFRLMLSGCKSTKSSSGLWRAVNPVQISLARPIHDLCCRNHVFLVVVVFKFEFVVRRPEF